VLISYALSMSVDPWWVKKSNLSEAPWSTSLKLLLQPIDSQSSPSKIGVKEFADSNVSLLKTWFLSLNILTVFPQGEEQTFVQVLTSLLKPSKKENTPIKSLQFSSFPMDKIKVLKLPSNKLSKEKKLKMFSQFIHLDLVLITMKT